MAMIQAGTTFNVIPDSATISGTFRAFSKKSFNALRKRIEEVTNKHLDSFSFEGIGRSFS